MTGTHRKLTTLATCAALLYGPALTAQTGSVLSDLASDEVQAKYRAAAAKQIACDPITDWDAQMSAFAANATSKWDRQAMGCAVEYGAQAMEDLSLPSNLIWAVATFRTDNIETHLNVLGAHLEYFDVLDKSYSDHYQGAEIAAELGLRWERTRDSARKLLDRIDPIVPKVTEARVLRAAFNLGSTLRETSPDAQSAALEAAIEDLQIAIGENPEALNGLAQLLLGQVLAVLPEFLGGDIDAAITLLEQAQALNPGDLTVHRTLAEAYLGERETEKAIALLEAALQADVSGENPQDLVDDAKFLGGLALRADRPDLASQFGQRRDALLTEKPFLETRKETAAMGHGGEDPLSGKDPSDLN